MLSQQDNDFTARQFEKAGRITEKTVRIFKLLSMITKHEICLTTEMSLTIMDTIKKICNKVNQKVLRTKSTTISLILLNLMSLLLKTKTIKTLLLPESVT